MKIIIPSILILLLIVSCAPKEVMPPLEDVKEDTKPADTNQVKTDAEPVQEDEESEEEPSAPVPVNIPEMTSTITPARDLTGNWAGSMTFTNNCPNPSCRYRGRMNPPSITINLVQAGNTVNGNVAIDFANFDVDELVPRMGCNTFLQMGRVQSVIQNGVISSTRFMFTDVGGNEWDMMLTTNLLQGTIKNDEPGCMGIASDNVKLSRQN